MKKHPFEIDPLWFLTLNEWQTSPSITQSPQTIIKCNPRHLENQELEYMATGLSDRMKFNFQLSRIIAARFILNGVFYLK